MDCELNSIGNIKYLDFDNYTVVIRDCPCSQEIHTEVLKGKGKKDPQIFKQKLSNKLANEAKC